MYAIPILLMLVTLIALVYLPKIRRPAMWMLISIVALGVVGVGAWLANISYQEREAAQLRRRELSYVVDHAIRPPPQCSRVAGKAGSNEIERLLRKADQPAKRARGSLDDIFESAEKPAPKETRPFRNGGDGSKTDPTSGRAFDPDAFLSKLRKSDQPATPKGGDGNTPATPADLALFDQPVPGEPPGLATSTRGDRIDQLLDAFVSSDAPSDRTTGNCKGEVEALRKFTKDHDDDLNEFIRENQSDPRVDTVQFVLWFNGLRYKKTCKNLRDEKRDAYELHQQGCK